MWFFRSKFERLVDLKETEKRIGGIKSELEKGDVPALIIAAVKVFFPVVLVVFLMLLVLSRWLAR
jgi:hypothetical protein